MKKWLFDKTINKMDTLNRLYVDGEIRSVEWLDKIRDLELDLELAKKTGAITKDDLNMLMLVIESKIYEAQAVARIEHQNECMKKAYGL